MHEMSLAEGMLQIIEDAARQDRFTKVITVWLEIGQLASADPQAMAFCFDAVTRHTIAAGARLEIIQTLGMGRCTACAKTVPVTELFGACPDCGGYQVEVTDGTAMRIKELEVA